MERIRIKGGKSLSGRLHLFGAKNAALPLMASSLLTEATLTLNNLPNLVDINTMKNLLMIYYDGFPIYRTNLSGGPIPTPHLEDLIKKPKIIKNVQKCSKISGK